jgi:hypothetical protein
VSQLKTWSIDRGTVVTAKPGETNKKGSGKHTRLYTGRSGDYFYRSYVRFAHDWTNVGRIVSAYLILTTDDDGTTYTAGSAPKFLLRRCTSTFGAKTNGTLDTFYSDGWTKPAAVTEDQKYVEPTVVTDAITRIDITPMVNDWAPKGVTRSDGKTNTAPAGNYGIAILDVNQTDKKLAWAGWGKEAAANFRPYIELVYEYGKTTPDTPTGLTPSGTIGDSPTFTAPFSDPRSSDELRYAQIQVYNSSATQSGQTVTGTKYWDHTRKQSNAAITAGVASISSDYWPTMKTRTTYKYRMRVQDQEGVWSLWSDLVSFYISNDQPTVSSIAPLGYIYNSFRNLKYTFTYSDPNGNRCTAYQVQMAALADTDPNWDDPTFLVWDTGKTLVSKATYSPSTITVPYSGGAVAADNYNVRVRVWDLYGLASDWYYGDYNTLNTDYEPDSALTDSLNAFQPEKPWRIVIRGMGANRGPGTVAAIIYNAKEIGATMLYNSPGEMHFTLDADHPQVSVIEPKQTHYALEFYTGDAWREVYAGLVWDFDATDRQVVFYGVDYLSLFDTVYDERYDPANPDKPYDKGGSKYVDKTISQVVTDQLQRAIGLDNSPVGFITVGTVDTMAEKVTVFSTMQPTLQFITGLVESHRQGTGNRTRIAVRKVGAAYKVNIDDDPGTQRDELRLSYGELVNGYRAVAFGDAWATVQHAIGRTRDGIRVLYKTESAPGISQATWGRFARVNVYDGVSDENDLIRRTKQAAMEAGKLGKRMGLALRSGLLLPLDGYDLCDTVPVSIDHGVVDTSAWGGGYWTIVGVTFQTGIASGNEKTNTDEPVVTLSLTPREDTVAPDTDLIPTRPISPQAEWQVGYTPPDVVNASARYWLDQNTGKVYVRNETLVTDPQSLTGTASTDVFSLVAHGYANDDIVYLYNLTGGTGLTEYNQYYIINKTDDTFQLSASLGGGAVDFTTDVSAGTVQNAPAYDEVDPAEPMAPPPVPSTPSAPSIDSALQGGIVRIEVTL